MPAPFELLAAGGFHTQADNDLRNPLCVFALEPTVVQHLNIGAQIYIACAVKIETYDQFLAKYGLSDEEVMYMGDDIPDLEIMRRVGCPVCPKDACPEIKDVSLYVSDCKGGYGCGRDVIEQTLRAQGKWVMNAKAFGW